MKIFVIIIPLLVISVSLLVRLEIKKQKKGIYSAKPISTILVIVTCLLSLFDIGASVPFTLSILLGLLFSFGGDMALMFQERATYFRAGLVLFLVAHIVYGGAFVSFAGSVPQFPLIAALFFGLGTAIYLLLLPGLGKMKVSVGLYILIISFMAAAAVSTLYSPDITPKTAILVTAGSLLFYISDVILALNRFRFPMKYNRLSLIPYYAGQFMIAVSTYYFVEVV
ncbi:MAG: lysoplasmalogenase [Deltaproteobacteria bacterium]|nr:lysoplasmalogenase [Candidatus Zymogenaceae bacterium]